MIDVDELLEELVELRRENARLRILLRKKTRGQQKLLSLMRFRVSLASHELNKGTEPVKLAKELGFPSACVMVEEVLRWRGERD